MGQSPGVVFTSGSAPRVPSLALLLMSHGGWRFGFQTTGSREQENTVAAPNSTREGAYAPRRIPGLRATAGFEGRVSVKPASRFERLTYPNRRSCLRHLNLTESRLLSLPGTLPSVLRIRIRSVQSSLCRKKRKVVEMACGTGFIPFVPWVVWLRRKEMNSVLLLSRNRRYSFLHNS